MKEPQNSLLRINEKFNITDAMLLLFPRLNVVVEDFQVTFL